MNRRCIEQQTPPHLQPGDTLDAGEFFRNLKTEHVVKRYAGDDNENPVYGFKLHKSHWKYADRQQGPLSVNLCSCIHSEVCSIALHPGGKDYFHVAVINLGAINSLEALRDSPFVAQYQPIDAIPNRCHFEIVPRDGTVLQWMAIGVLLEQPFPPANKLPVTPDNQKIALEQYARFRSCLDIRRWVRDRDGKLSA